MTQTEKIAAAEIAERILVAYLQAPGRYTLGGDDSAGQIKMVAAAYRTLFDEIASSMK